MTGRLRKQNRPSWNALEGLENRINKHEKRRKAQNIEQTLNALEGLKKKHEIHRKAQKTN